jgi:hypothetical protein
LPVDAAKVVAKRAAKRAKVAAERAARRRVKRKVRGGRRLVVALVLGITIGAIGVFIARRLLASPEPEDADTRPDLTGPATAADNFSNELDPLARAR